MESTHFQSQHSLNHTCYKNINKLIYRKQIGTVYFSLDRFVCSFHFGIDSNLFNNRRIRVSIITGPTFDKCHLKPNILFTFVSLKSKTCESIRPSSLLNIICNIHPASLHPYNMHAFLSYYMKNLKKFVKKKDIRTYTVLIFENVSNTSESKRTFIFLSFWSSEKGYKKNL